MTKAKVKEKEEATLEELFQSLEDIIVELEGEDVPLEESFRFYKEGMDVLKQCSQKIDTIEKKVMILDESGETHEF